MEKKPVYDKFELNYIKKAIDTHEDQTIPTNDSMVILNLCTDMAQKIKEQVVDQVGHATTNIL
ncbi:hypothetical protein I4U23_018364 [Adineta vaga]|nr:hypothetical protein I4U23_018364 [Adineta vaga]